MEGIQTHPANAAQAKAFITPGSLSFPSAANELVLINSGGSQRMAPNGRQAENGVTPVTPAATPAATPATSQGPNSITPTLQYVYT